MSGSQFTPDPGWQVFDPEPSKPMFVLPPGTVDTHCHVFGPGDRFPYAPGRSYTPSDASAEQLFSLRDFLGVDRNVIVQGSCHGMDNSALLDTLDRAQGRARGIASIGPNTTQTELSDMDARGVRGVRFNFVRRLAEPQPDAYYRNLVERIAGLGWHILVYIEMPDLIERGDLLAALPVVVVVDHMGRPDVSQGVNGREFQSFLELMALPHMFTKVTAPERASQTGAPYDDVVPFGFKLVEAFPERVMWGTDWPHPNLRTEMPDDGHLVDFIPRIAPSLAAQKALLVTNPRRLYWPDERVSRAESAHPSELDGQPLAPQR